MKLNILASAALVFLLTISCTEKLVIVDNSIPEVAYCTTTSTFTTSYTISGSAEYQKRIFYPGGLGYISGTTYPIRNAEVVVLDSGGATVQCTETDSSGNFSFDIPDDGETYTVRVNSRSYNQYNKASVLTDPTSNNFYYISQTFTADSSKTLPDMIASASDANLVAGAFNILDQIYRANDFLLNNTAGTFSVNHKVQAYWKKGFNPITYYGGDADNGVSFFIPAQNKLFILGGTQGDVATTDTDHFDDSVIIHEYGHFIENNYSASDSQGGSHSGNSVIDPRLAWSEGFSNFFASAVTGDPVYRDTVGHRDGGDGNGSTTSFGYYYDMENNLNGDIDPMDTPTASGEGGFRELAVARFLWDAIDPHPVTFVDDDSDGIQMPFSEFWNIYTDEFKNEEPFREMSLLLKHQETYGSTDLSSLLSASEMLMDATRAHYGTVSSGANCTWTIEAKENNSSYSNEYQRSNQFHSNDFYYYYHSGGTLSATLNYDNSVADLDLYVYKNNYSFGYGDDIQLYSKKDRDVDMGTEYVSASIPAGHYMINVMYYVGIGGTSGSSTTYTLKINNNFVCK